MRKALLLTFLLFLAAAWVGCGESTHTVTPTSQVAFIRAASGGALAYNHQSRELRGLRALPARKAHRAWGCNLMLTPLPMEPTPLS